MPGWQLLVGGGFGRRSLRLEPLLHARLEIRLGVRQRDLHRDFAFIKFFGWRRQLCTIQRFDVAAFANCVSALLPFMLHQVSGAARSRRRRRPGQRRPDQDGVLDENLACSRTFSSTSPQLLLEMCATWLKLESLKSTFGGPVHDAIMCAFA